MGKGGIFNLPNLAVSPYTEGAIVVVWWWKLIPYRAQTSPEFLLAKTLRFAPKLEI